MFTALTVDHTDLGHCRNHSCILSCKPLQTGLQHPFSVGRSKVGLVWPASHYLTCRLIVLMLKDFWLVYKTVCD